MMTVDEDTNVRMMFKINDEHGYVYVSGKDSLVHCVSNAVGARAGKIRADDEDTRVGRNGRRDDGGAVEEMQASDAHGSRKR